LSKIFFFAIVFEMTLTPPSKINLHLKVGGKKDGFHAIESLFLALDLADVLYIEESGDKSLTLEIGGPQCGGVPNDERNLVWRAVDVFRKKTGYNKPLSIGLEKRIPNGAGLGGGSSDAASTLMALNALWKKDGGEGLSEAALRELGALLGSDFLFFLALNGSSPAAWVSGRGEEVELLDSGHLAVLFEKLAVVLVKPDLHSSTAVAYACLDAWREGGGHSASGLEKGSAEAMLLKKPSEWVFYNDFLPVFLAEPAAPGLEEGASGLYRQVLDALQKSGAAFSGLSGSGSACFGIFETMEEAKRAAGCLKHQGGLKKFEIYVTFPLAHFPKRVLQYTCKSKDERMKPNGKGASYGD
jgi:4-diphosphocytidyl-2-C-methyl-D-erythritol kinase